jgi:uncharacterized protein (TIGR03437 family)
VIRLSYNPLLCLSILVATLYEPSFAQPVVTSLGPGASYLPDGLSGSGIAQGSFFYLKGTGLGPASPVIANAYPLGTSLGGVSIKVMVGDQPVDAFPWYVSQSQINAILPSTTPLGSGNAQVTWMGLSASIPIQVVSSAYGIFTLNGAGTGAAVITDQNYKPITLINSAHPGDALVLWGTGLGAVPFPFTCRSVRCIKRTRSRRFSSFPEACPESGRFLSMYGFAAGDRLQLRKIAPVSSSK